MIGSSSLGDWSVSAGRRRGFAAVAIAIVLLALRQSGAQTQALVFNRDVVVLDPAHGGTDTGAKISDSLYEKDVTLELALRLRSLLVARGFTVISTRDGSEGAGLATDQRAEIANKAHAVACLVIHATGSGNGVQIGMSTIGSPLASIPDGRTSQLSGGAVPWNRAQEVYVPQSLRLADRVGAAMARSNIPLAISRVALRPLDNLMCPALSIELAPKLNSSGDPTPISDANYQQRVADAIAGALVFWRSQAEPPVPAAVPSASITRPDVPADTAGEQEFRGFAT